MSVHNNIDANEKHIKLWKKTNVFFKENIYLILFTMIILNVLTLWSNSSFKEEALEKIEMHGTLLKQNLPKVYFLTAGGQLLVGDRKAINYADDKFKSYLLATLTDSLIQGAVELGVGKKTQWRTPNDIKKKNRKIHDFSNALIANKSVLGLYIKTIWQTVRDTQLPEYIIPIDIKMKNFTVERNAKVDGEYHLQGAIKIEVLIKSWISEIGDWDTRKTKVEFPFVAVVNPARYSNIGNPFGIKFTQLDVPVIVKPSASVVKQGRLSGKRRNRGRKVF